MPISGLVGWRQWLKERVRGGSLPLVITLRLLRPVHDWGMEVLHRISQDGTFNQQAPIIRLSVYRPMDIYSFDLKSATDRWPLVIIYTLMELLFGPTWASSIVNGTLGLNSFWAMVRRPSLVSFVAGQPLGYYGSWALFSLSHHYLVWLAIELTLPQNRPFTRYAVLGDDIVIVHPKVAGKYKEMLGKWGVSISVGKSLISPNGPLEFAKKYWVRGSKKKDLSPISIRALLTVRSTLGLTQLGDLYKIYNPNVLFRLAGAGYRVRSRLYSSRRSPRWERLWIAATKPPVSATD
ncbi:LOW QUALITY PROTEIN: putative mitochondrial protein AtMg01110 [Primulina tabacum]|uniref:LOW QUALITY PROTEIN: putative mitochondrial protein AtMg01110 n=1 Tax=Primulina tabacum TaxID=48773 RepID=UPI003F5A5672